MSVDCVAPVAVCQEKQEENELRALPPASAAQLRAVDAAVLETARQEGISEEDFDVRQSVVTRMEEIIKEHLSGRRQWCSLFAFLMEMKFVSKNRTLTAMHVQLLSSR